MNSHHARSRSIVLIFMVALTAFAVAGCDQSTKRPSKSTTAAPTATVPAAQLEFVRSC